MDLTGKVSFGCSDLLSGASDDPKTAQAAGVSETAMLQNTVAGKYCPQHTFIQNNNIKVIFLTSLSESFLNFTLRITDHHDFFCVKYNETIKI